MPELRGSRRGLLEAVLLQRVLVRVVGFVFGHGRRFVMRSYEVGVMVGAWLSLFFVAGLLWLLLKFSPEGLYALVMGCMVWSGRDALFAGKRDGLP